MRTRIAALITIAVLAALAWELPMVRRELIRDVTTADAEPAEPAPLPSGTGPGLGKTPRTRVVLIDGLTADMASELPHWTRVCSRGMTLTVEVGFPTISLPVELALWSGLTQQQSGVMFRSDHPLDPPLDRRGIPAQIAGSWAVAENHGWIVRSLGFSRVEPGRDPSDPVKDADAKAWEEQWQARAVAAVTSPAPLVFVHILRVDVAGHRHGLGAEYEKVAHESDEILATLVALDPAARWFVLSDHGHLATGGHGGEEPTVRHVQGCIAGPGVAVARAELVHVVDVARAIADSTGATLVTASRGRPISVALAQPLAPNQGLPPMALHRGALAIFLLVAGLGAVSWGVRRWWLAPWWFVVACVTLVVVRGVPTLSTPMIYKPEGRDMYLTWLPALAIAFAATVIGLRRTTLGRVLVAQLALPIAATAAVLTVTGAWLSVFGADIAPVVPRYTAWMSPMLLMTAHGVAAVALGVLANLVRVVVKKPDASG
jgi:hypothetical protein